MNPTDCGEVREWIPAHARDPRAYRSGALEEHLRDCAGCRAELELARMLYVSRPEAPEGLAARIRDRIHEQGRAIRHPAWGLTAAAVAALALGIGLSSGNGDGAPAPAFAQELTEDWTWPSEDALVAGAPVLDDLSDADLAMLLDDLAADAGRE